MAIELHAGRIEPTTRAVVRRYEKLALAASLVQLLAIPTALLLVVRSPLWFSVSATVFWVALARVLARRIGRKIEHVTAVGAASSGESLKWFLEGTTVVAKDARGRPQPDRSFEVTAKQRAELTALPRAALVQRSE